MDTAALLVLTPAFGKVFAVVVANPWVYCISVRGRDIILRLIGLACSVGNEIVPVSIYGHSIQRARVLRRIDLGTLLLL